MDTLLTEFVFFFTVIDPIGTVPVFLAATARNSPAGRRKIALRAAAAAAGILLGSVVVGQLLLERLQIDFSAFRVAGGIILFIFALNMIFGESKPDNEVAEAEKHLDDDLDTAIYPIAIPSIAGPGAIMAAIIKTDNELYSFANQAATTGVIGVVLVFTLVAMLAASSIQNLIGRAGASIISRVMGLLFAAMAADSVLSGVRDFFQVPTT